MPAGYREAEWRGRNRTTAGGGGGCVCSVCLVCVRAGHGGGTLCAAGRAVKEQVRQLVRVHEPVDCIVDARRKAIQQKGARAGGEWSGREGQAVGSIGKAGSVKRAYLC